MNIESIREICRGKVLADESLAHHTSFKTGGSADIYVIPEDIDELKRLIRLLRDDGTDYFILGKGTNILASDEGFRGVIIDLGHHPGTEFTRIRYELKDDGIWLYPGSGVLMSEVGAKAQTLHAAGFEALTGIPGSVGGAVIMNAGAYGTEMKDVLVSVFAVDRDGNSHVLSLPEAGLRYRGSSVMDRGFIVTGAVLHLHPGDPEMIAARTEDFTRRRQEKQPLEYPSAGSTFKRPPGQFAGRLIADAGLKGYAIGGAEVSVKHAGFIINKGGATSRDIYLLIQAVRDKVEAEYGVTLSPEVRFLGDFGYIG